MGGGIRPVEVPGEVVRLAGAPADRQPALREPRLLRHHGHPAALRPRRRHRRQLTARRVAVVSEEFVREHFPDGKALERTFKFADEDRTIVGVVGEVRMRGLERQNEPQVYLPYAQVADGEMTNYAPHELVLRTSGDPYAQLPAVRAIVRRADSEVPIGTVREVAEVVWGQTASRRTQVWLLGAYAGAGPAARRDRHSRPAVARGVAAARRARAAPGDRRRPARDPRPGARPRAAGGGDRRRRRPGARLRRGALARRRCSPASSPVTSSPSPSRLARRC